MPNTVKAWFTKRDEKGNVLSTEEQELYEGDARDACEKFPKEWSMKAPKFEPGSGRARKPRKPAKTAKAETKFTKSKDETKTGDSGGGEKDA